MVRVEILNQRVHHVEDVMAEVRQTHELIKEPANAASFQHSERAEPFGESDDMIAKESKDVIELQGNSLPLFRFKGFLKHTQRW